jgi:hypothetical protein
MPNRLPSLLFAGTLLLAACALPPLQPRSPTDRTMPAGDARAPRLERKEVVEKRDVNLLVARDGTTCTVASGVFRATIVGERVRCFWRRAPAQQRR